MKNQLLLFVALIIACDATGGLKADKTSTNLKFEQYILECVDGDESISIDLSDAPMVNYYIRLNGATAPREFSDLNDISAGNSGEGPYIYDCDGYTDGRQYVFSVVRPS